MSHSVRLRGTKFQGYASAQVDGRLVSDRRSGFDTHEAAIRWAARREVELNGGEVGRDAEPVTVGELLDLGFAKFYEDTRSASVARSHVRTLKQGGGQLRLMALTDGAVEQLFDQLSSGRASSTMARMVATFSKIIRWGHKRGWLQRLPEFPSYQATRGRLRWLSDAEEVGMIQGLRRIGHDDDADLVAILADTGMRVSEALGLNWSQVEADVIRLHETKNDLARSVPVTPRVASVLQRRRNLQAGPFVGLVQGSFNRHWNAVRRGMGLQDDAEFVPHALRHGFASRLVQAAVPLQVVKELLGHRSMASTLIYAHLAPDNLRRAVEVLAERGREVNLAV